MNVDFDLHGRVLVRLVDPPAAAVAAVTADTGLTPTSARNREPAVVVTFTDDLQLPEPVRRVGRTAGFSGGHFVVGADAGARCVLPFGTTTDELAVRAERGVRHVPHLLALINLAMLHAGLLPLHAAAMVVGGRGLVVTGWSKGGKTETVLGLMSRGATFVADEWCYLDPETRTAFGLRHPVRVWDWQLDQLPAVRASLTAKQRARLAVTARAARAGALRATLDPTRGVSLAPEQLFDLDRIATSCATDVVVLVEARDAPDLEVRRIEPVEVAACMRWSLVAERADLAAELDRFRFAFPAVPTPYVDRALGREPALLDAALAGAPAWRVSHPYPVELAALARAVEQLG